MVEISATHLYSDFKNILFQKVSRVVTSCWKPDMLESCHTLCVCTRHWAAYYKKFLPLPWILKVGEKQISQDGDVRLSRSGPMFCKYTVTYPLSALTVQRMRFTRYPLGRRPLLLCKHQ